MIDYYAPILILAIWSALASYVFIRSPKSYLTRWVMIPASLVAAVLYGYANWASFGYAVPLGLPDQFTFLGYNTVIVANKKTSIEVWVEAQRTRLYVIPYSKEAEKALKDAAEKKKGGGVVQMKRRKEKPNDPANGDKDGRADYPYESNLLLPSDINPKNDAPAEPPQPDRSWI